jgi:predicted N-acetyltransferase YhbS
MTQPTQSEIRIRTAHPDEVERIGRLRSRCYKPKFSDEAELIEQTKSDRASLEAGDFLIAERDGRDLATTTAMRGEMNVRGTMLPCQGIAYVGTAHDARRAGGAASKTIWHAIGLARERGEPLSALMPFRASYYETFGYGLCERRALWTIPTILLPKGETSSFRFIEPDDDESLDKMADARQRQMTHPRLGHGDVWFPSSPQQGIEHWRDHYRESGYLFADVADDGSFHGWLGTVPVYRDGRAGLQVQHMIFDTPAGFMRQLHFLATLKDQYGLIELATPVDRPIHLLLKETQLPHRGVEHPHATFKVAARNQVRVLDHERVLTEPAWPVAEREGSMVVQINEPEDHTVKLKLDVADGRCEARSVEASPDFTCDAKTWASIVLGELNANWAVDHALADGDAGLLSDFMAGPLPFCREYF